MQLQTLLTPCKGLHVSSDLLFSKFQFPNIEQQNKLFQHLKKERNSLYKGLDADKRTLFLRETGDNFRAGAHQPTEQMSFSILNLTDLINSPNGQFLSSIWRGPESRQYIKAHMKGHYKDVTQAVEQGLALTINGSFETFNVIAFCIADLCHLKETLGKCLCTAMYGCYWCRKKISAWDDSRPSTSPPQTIADMETWAKQAEKVLGENPLKGSTAYTKFQQSHFAQTGMPIFSAFSESCLLPCGLHLILAIHRSLWKMLFGIVSKRGQETQLPAALRNINCGYLAYQIETYHKR